MSNQQHIHDISANSLQNTINRTRKAVDHIQLSVQQQSSTGNLQATGGSVTGLTTLSATTGTVTNLSSSNVTVTGGTVNGTVIGGTTAAAATFTTVTGTGNASFASINKC